MASVEKIIKLEQNIPFKCCVLKYLNFCAQFSKFREDSCPVSDTLSEKTHGPLPLNQVQGKGGPAEFTSEFR